MNGAIVDVPVRVAVFVCACVLVLPIGCTPDADSVFLDLMKEDPKATEKVVADFFKVNPPASLMVHVKVLMNEGDRDIYLEDLVKDQIVKSVKEDTRSRPEAGFPDCPWSIQITLSGPKTALQLWCDCCGFGLGNCDYRFVNPRLAACLKKLLKAEGLLSGEYGKGLEFILKKGAGEISSDAEEEDDDEKDSSRFSRPNMAQWVS